MGYINMTWGSLVLTQRFRMCIKINFIGNMEGCRSCVMILLQGYLDIAKMYNAQFQFVAVQKKHWKYAVTALLNLCIADRGNLQYTHFNFRRAQVCSRH